MKKIVSALLIAASLWGYGDRVVYWVPHGCETGKAVAAKHGGHGKKESAMFALMNLEGNASATLILPDLSVNPLSMNQNILILPKPAMGGYYALVLNHRTNERIESAIRYLSLQGRPAKISPTKLTALTKADLEIVPAPLHREHDHYTASKSYTFIVMLQGNPLSNAPVTLETQNGTSHTYTADTKGAIRVTLPNDFSHVTVGRNENKPSEFLLSTTYSEGDIVYQSTLTMPYYVNPNDYWQSQRLGAGVIVIGFLGGLLLYRRHQKQGVSRG